MLTPRPRNPYHLAALISAKALAPSRPGPRMSRISSSRTSLPKYPSTIARLAAPQSVAANCWTTGIFGELRPSRRRSSAGNFSKMLIGAFSLSIGIAVHKFQLRKQGHQDAPGPNWHLGGSLHPILVGVRFPLRDEALGRKAGLDQDHRPQQAHAVGQLLPQIAACLNGPNDFISHRVHDEVGVAVFVAGQLEPQPGAELNHRPVVTRHELSGYKY